MERMNETKQRWSQLRYTTIQKQVIFDKGIAPHNQMHFTCKLQGGAARMCEEN